MPLIRVSKLISDTLYKQIKDARDVIGTTVEVTRDITQSSLGAIRGKKAEAQQVAEDAVEGAIRAGSDAGSDLGSIAKGAVMGTIEGIGDVTKVTSSILRYSVGSAIKGTSEVGGDVAVVARKAVEGAIEAGKQAGFKAEDAASAAASGAIEAAGEFGEAVASSVAKSLSGTISGVRMVFQIPSKKQTILAVIGNRKDADMMEQQLRKEGYQVYTVSSGKELSRLTQTGERNISAAIVDITDLDDDIWDECTRLKKLKIPFLVLSPKRSPVVQQESVKCGAGGVLTKPLEAKELTEHIRSLLGN
jgi:CheY-like chemotaxis protein